MNKSFENPPALISGKAPMELTMHMSGVGVFPAGEDLSHWTVSAYCEAPHETMTFTVVVPNQGGEDAMKAQAILRAKELARKFCETAQVP